MWIYIFWVDLYISGRHICFDNLIEYVDKCLGIRLDLIYHHLVLLFPEHLFNVLDVNLQLVHLLVRYLLLNTCSSYHYDAVLELPQPIIRLVHLLV